jgi:hypothetical protein
MLVLEHALRFNFKHIIEHRRREPLAPDFAFNQARGFKAEIA